MQAFQQNLTKLEAADTQVLGVSMDSTFANKAWAEQIGVQFPLLSDRGGEVTHLYGIFNPNNRSARRATFVISPQGKIENIQLDTAALDPADTVAVCTRKKLKG
jgi:peroxiredoxin (alkyl hydroperoxide reductase subunit C)